MDLRDSRARARIAARLVRLEAGNAGVTRSVGNGIFDLKIDYGPGYRVYYLQRGDAGNPELGTLLRILQALGVKLSASIAA